MNLLKELRQKNLIRKDVYAPKDKNSDWSLPEWGNATAGEVGEMCNIIKKIRRGDFTLDEKRQDLADEIADIIIYLDLLAHTAEIDIEEAIISKFNRTSDRQKLPDIKLSKQEAVTKEEDNKIWNEIIELCEDRKTFGILSKIELIKQFKSNFTIKRK